MKLAIYKTPSYIKISLDECLYHLINSKLRLINKGNTYIYCGDGTVFVKLNECNSSTNNIN